MTITVTFQFDRVKSLVFLWWSLIETWTPLFSGIVAASVWSEPYHVRLVWITILAMKDRKGFLSSSVPGLARLANVTRAECEDALRRLESPDPDSKCQDDHGIRLNKVDGGWQVLGHDRAIEKMKAASSDIKRLRASARQARYRAKKKRLAGDSGSVSGSYLSREKRFENAKSQADADEIAAEGLPRTK